MKVQSLVIMILVAFVTGCVWAPGMQFKDPPPGVKIYPITADLIAKQRLNNSPEGELPPSQEGGYQYRIGAQDVLNITVYDHPELTIPAGEFRSAETAGNLVSEEGTIYFPYAGVVHVAGKTMIEVRDILTQKIAHVIRDPQLDVRVAGFRSQRVYVTGEVQNEGPQLISDIPLTVVNAINVAGGRTESGDIINVTLKRDGKIYPIDLLSLYENGDVAQDVVLRHGDILHVPDVVDRKIFVLGEFSQQQTIIMNRDRRTISLTEAIGEVGGVDQRTSRPSHLYVIRGSELEPEIYWLDAKSPTALILGEQFQLEPRDVVFVDTAGVTRWNRVISQILPTANLIRTGTSI